MALGTTFGNVTTYISSTLESMIDRQNPIQPDTKKKDAFGLTALDICNYAAGKGLLERKPGENIFFPTKKGLRTLSRS